MDKGGFWPRAAGSKGVKLKALQTERGEGKQTPLVCPTVPPWWQGPQLVPLADPGTTRGNRPTSMVTASPPCYTGHFGVFGHAGSPLGVDGIRIGVLGSGQLRNASLASCRVIPAELLESGSVCQSWSICLTRRCGLTLMGTASPPC